ncbi:MAG: hypothetical protein JRD89_00255 [Deltaproteobacteria bacterium]|nr:hypothetical protein [Deltaproteobacteria bacterium]
MNCLSSKLKQVLDAMQQMEQDFGHIETGINSLRESTTFIKRRLNELVWALWEGTAEARFMDDLIDALHVCASVSKTIESLAKSIRGSSDKSLEIIEEVCEILKENAR